MEGVNLVAETGLGDWLRKRREKLGLQPSDVAQAASVSTRTVQRYERDQGPSFELLRLLDALSIRVRPAPKARAARALNAEVQELRVRLESFEARIVELPTKQELIEGLDTLRAAIDRVANRDTGEDPLPEAAEGP